ncbi:MAG: hypothetical protein JNK89_06975, partial [Saprospiraceae bacterium]|nr:hypothetical protein [Saprospiraceae bacterium]
DLATLLSNASLDCNKAADTSFQRNSTAGPVNYQYQVDLGWLVHCNNAGIPQSADLSLTGAGAFAAQHWSGSTQSDGALRCTGLNPQATAYLFNGNYDLEGQLTGQLRNTDPTLDISIALQLTDLSLRKSDRLITGGTGAFTLTATNGRGRTETITGTLVFNGDGTATVTVNGYAHTFPLK